MSYWLVRYTIRMSYQTENSPPTHPVLPEHGPDQETEFIAFLEQQYVSQLTLLVESGLIFPLPDSSTLGCVGIDGQPHPVPSWEQIASSLQKDAQKISKLQDQGFTKLLLVPIAAPLTAFEAAFSNVIAKKKTVVDLENNPVVDIDRQKPVSLTLAYLGSQSSVELGENIFRYYPETFDPQLFQQDKSVSKSEYISANQAWQVLLTQNTLTGLKRLDNFPLTRGKMDATTSQLRMFREQLFPDEVGLTVESWSILALSALQAQGKILNHEQFLLLGTSTNEALTATNIGEWMVPKRVLITYRWPYSDFKGSFIVFTSESLNAASAGTIIHTAVPMLIEL